MSELDNGKKINSRSYSMLILSASEPKFTNMRLLRLGSKVPVAVGTNGNGLEYMDIGMNIDCRILPTGNGKVVVGANFEYSTIENEQERETGHPVIRHVSSQVEAAVPLGKPDNPGGDGRCCFHAPLCVRSEGHKDK